jgi:hypothetical protein
MTVGIGIRVYVQPSEAGRQLLIAGINYAIPLSIELCMRLLAAKPGGIRLPEAHL